MGFFEERNSFPKKARKSLCENLIGQEKVELGGKKDFLSSYLLLRRFILLLFYFLVECRLPFASLLSTPPFTLSPRRLATLFSLTSRSRAQKKDVFIVAPTGSGKSVCFHLIPRLFRALSNLCGAIVVISPIVWLIEDQIDRLVKSGEVASRLWLDS